MLGVGGVRSGTPDSVSSQPPPPRPQYAGQYAAGQPAYQPHGHAAPAPGHLLTRDY